MAPSKRRPTQDKLDSGQRQILQAVILADNFDDSFHPLSLGTPQTLIPLLNIPMLDYAIEFLIANDVDEIFVLTARGHRQVLEHMERYKRIKLSKSVKLHTVVSEDSLSAGDAMRDLDSRGLLESDFVLVWGDLVSNMNLKGALQKHRERRQKDKSVIMTTVFQEMAPQTPTKSNDEDVLVAMTEHDSRLLHYENSRHESTMNLDMSLFAEHDALQVRSDLVDTYVDICSLEMLICFTDNFDYQDIRKDLLRGVLRDDILGSKVYAHVLPTGEYARRARDPKAYSVIGHALLQGWVHPIIPSANLTPNTSFSYRKSRIYREDEGVVLARSAQCSNSALGAQTTVGDNTIIKGCVIGRKCVIGDSSRLVNCILWDNIVIGDDVLIEDGCVLGAGVVISSGATVSSGSLLGPGVRIGPNHFVKAQRRLTTLSDQQVQDLLDGFESDGGDGEDTEDEVVVDIEVVGEGGQGRVYVLEQDESDDDSDSDSDEDSDAKNDEGRASLADGATSRAWCSQCGADHSLDVKKDDAEDETRRGSVDDDDQFLTEVTETTHRGIKNNMSISNIGVEIKQMQILYNRNPEDIGVAVLKSVLLLLDAKAGKEGLQAWKKIMNTWHSLITATSNDDQIELIFVVQEYILDGNGQMSHFPFILQILYEVDTLSEQAILQWADEQEHAEGEEREFLTKLQPFLTWLREAEEEYSTESDEEDS